MYKPTFLIPCLFSLVACSEISSTVNPMATPATTASETVLLAIQDVQEEPKGCSLTVRFGSYAMGIDSGAAQSVERLLTTQTGVSEVTRHAWGKEGEYTLCTRTRTDAAAVALFDKIRPLLPAEPRGPIRVALAGGRSFSRPAN